MTGLKTWGKNHPLLVTTLLFLLVAFVMILPQLLSGGVVFGADVTFHYNRFYDAAEQIRHLDFEPYISLYGFQESGRIVNAVYGPLFAYLQGALVLISYNWFVYQLLSNFLLAFLAMWSMYLLATSAKVERKISLLLAVSYPATYAIQYWFLEQGFSSWGAALFPICFIPAIKLLETRQIRVLPLALAVAGMLQVHVLSTVILVVSYLPIYGYVFIKIEDKKRFIRQGLKAVGICLLLTINIWLPLVQLNLANPLKTPFINKKLPMSSITGDYSWMLAWPIVLVGIIGVVLISVLRQYKTVPMMVKVLFWDFALLVFLSTSVFPWGIVKNFPLVQMLQFPFRFFFYALPIMLVLLGLQLTYANPIRQKQYRRGLLAIALVGIVQIGGMGYYSVTSDYRTSTFLEGLGNTRVSGSVTDRRQSVHSTDKKRLLVLMQKSTPDYVLYELGNRCVSNPTIDNGGSYQMYRHYIIDNPLPVHRSVKHGVLTLTWQAEKDEKVTLPIIVYAGSRLTVNGQNIDTKTVPVRQIGAPVVPQKRGQNTVTLSYPGSEIYAFMTLIEMVIWGVLIRYLGKEEGRNAN